MPKQGKNIYLRKDGRWEGRYIKERVNGKARYGYVFGKSYEEALDKLVQATCQSTDTQNLPSITFGAVSSEWLAVQMPELKASSVARYRNLLNSYILPKFSKSIIQEIQRSEIVVFSRDLLTSGGVHSQGLAPKTVNSALSVLKNVFTYASNEKGCTRGRYQRHLRETAAKAHPYPQQRGAKRTERLSVYRPYTVPHGNSSDSLHWLEDRRSMCTPMAGYPCRGAVPLYPLDDAENPSRG